MSKTGTPPILENWLAADRGAPLLQTIEVPLYTDAWITGAAEHIHPYEIINLVPINAPHDAPTLLLRADLHIDQFARSLEPDDSTWTGASSLGDELAALLSLAMGARVAAGAVTRTFTPGQDPKGRPHSDHGPKIPRHVGVYNRRAGPVGVSQPLVPSTLGPTGVDPEMLELLHRTPTTAATVLIRAARAYRDALWLCEDEPALAWLLLVSAVEVAAVFHRDSGVTDVAELLKTAAPKKFLAALESLGPDALTLTAPHLVKFFGSTSRFLAFIDAFCPPAPEKRSQPPFTQIEWTPTSIRKATARIYSHRSDALHGGVPFPAPMYFPPMTFVNDVPAERPLGGGMHGGKWDGEDCPMHLHIFEYIARHSLNAWWRSIATSAV